MIKIRYSIEWSGLSVPFHGSLVLTWILASFFFWTVVAKKSTRSESPSDFFFLAQFIFGFISASFDLPVITLELNLIIIPFYFSSNILYHIINSVLTYTNWLPYLSMNSSNIFQCFFNIFFSMIPVWAFSSCWRSY